MFSRRLRWLGAAYVVVAVCVSGIAASGIHGPREYYSAVLSVRVLAWVPGFLIAFVAGRRVQTGDQLVRRLWMVGFSVGCLASVLRLPLTTGEWASVRSSTIAVTAVLVALLVITDTLFLRSRSGQRALAIDLLDLVMASIAIVVPLALIAAEPIVTSPNAWYTVSSALWVIGSGYACLLLLVVLGRLRPGERGTARLGLALGLIAVADAVAQTVQGVHAFELPAGPFIASHCLCNGMIVIFFVWSPRRSSTGLERFALRDQARGRSAITVLVLVSVPLIVVGTWIRRDEEWAVLMAMIAGGVLLVLSSLRHLVSTWETKHLYSEVQRAADERRELLAEVMTHNDSERHRVAAHLHKQAAALYTAMAALNRTVEAPCREPSPLTKFAAKRLQDDLGHQSDELRQLAIAVKPLTGPGHREAPSMASLIRAYAEGLYGDARRPELEVDVDPELVLDWTAEAILMRLIQEAMHNVWRHAEASLVQVSVLASDDKLQVEVVDDGVGFATVRSGQGIASMRALAGFIGGEVTIISSPGLGTTVRATSPFAGLPPLGPRHLHLVEEA